MPEATVNRFFISTFAMTLAQTINSRYNRLPMDISNRSTTNKSKDRPALLIASFLLSILLHLLLASLLPWDDLKEAQTLNPQQQPTIVKLVDKPSPTELKQYELDQKPLKPAPEPPPESSRLAENNQHVPKEMAPKGDDSRDQAAKPAALPSPAQPPKQPTAIDRRPAPPKKVEQTPTTSPKLPTTETAQRPKHEEQPLPSLEQLTQLTPSTLGRIIRKEQAAQERIKERNDLETGDTVWLNLERGNLISFFRRFHNQIEGVWNYPREAIEKEQQGTLLLKIIVDREGELIDVELLRSSGSDALDFEAIQAVYRGAPFGPLGKHYPHPELKIMAHFRYQLTGKFIYGEKR